MADDATLREFLISIGFRVDRDSQKRFDQAIERSTRLVKEGGLAVAGAATIMAAKLKAVTEEYTRLYYASQLTNSTISDLSAWRYAETQVGQTGGAYAAAARHLQDMIKTAPLFEAQLRMWGIRTRDAAGKMVEGTELVDNLITRARQLPGFYTPQLAELAGVSTSQLIEWKLLLPEMQRQRAEWLATMKAAGITEEYQKNLADKVIVYDRAVGALWRDIQAGWIKTENLIVGPATTITNLLDKMVQSFTSGSDAMAALGTAATSLAAALGGVAAALGLIGRGAAALRILKLFGPLGVAATGLELGNAIVEGTGGWHAKPDDTWLSEAHKDKSAEAPPDLWGRLWGGFKGLFSPAHPLPYTPGADSSEDVDRKLRDWLSGSSAVAPAVRIDDFNRDALARLTGGAGGGEGGAGGAGGGAGGPAPDFSGSSNRGGPITGNEAARAQQLHAYMKEMGLDEPHAQALLANIKAESSFDPRASGDNRTSFGLFQHHADRWERMKKALGNNVWDAKAQLYYALHEPGEEAAIKAFLEAKGGAEMLTDLWQNRYERPKVQAHGARYPQLHRIQKMLATPQPDLPAGGPAVADLPFPTKGHPGPQGKRGAIGTPLQFVDKPGGTPFTAVIDAGKMTILDHDKPLGAGGGAAAGGGNQATLHAPTTINVHGAGGAVLDTVAALKDAMRRTYGVAVRNLSNAVN